MGDFKKSCLKKGKLQLFINDVCGRRQTMKEAPDEESKTVQYSEE